MGTMSKNVLKEFGGLIWHHPFIACCFLVLFTPPFFPVLRFFFPLLISTALFIVAIVTMGPHLREAATSINNEEEGGDVLQLIKHNNNLQLVPEVSWVDKTVLQLNDELVEEGEEEEKEEEQLEQQLHEDEDHKKTWQQLVETDHITGNPSSPSSKDQSEQEKKKTTSRWMDLRRIYKEKGINWIENLFRNENWKGAHGINDENVSILQEAFPHHHRDEEVEQKTVAIALESKKSSTDKSSSVELLKDFAGAYESDDGSDEGHSDLETGSPILQGNVHEEEEEAPIHHAPPPQEEHGILSLAVPGVPSWEQQPHSILHVPPALHDKLDVDPPAVLGIMTTEVQGSRLPVTKSIKENVGQRACHNLISGIHESGSSAATKLENLSSVLCREETSGSDNGLLEDAKSVSTTDEADRGIIIPVTTAIGDKSLGVGTGVDNNTPDLAIDTGILREEKSSCVRPIDATLGEEERSEVLSNTELHKEVVTLPATEVEEGERFGPHMKTHEKSSPVGASDEEMSPVNSDTDQVTKTDEETQTFEEEERLGLHNRTDSLCATEIGEPSSLPEEIVLTAAEIYKKPPVPWTNTLQKTSGNTSSREISVEGVLAIATHNHKENLIPTTEVLEQTGSHAPFSPNVKRGLLFQCLWSAWMMLLDYGHMRFL